MYEIDSPGSARSSPRNPARAFNRKKGAGARLDPLPSGGKRKNTIISKTELEEVLRRINQTPLPSQVEGKKIPSAPEIIDATATELHNLRENVANTCAKYNQTKRSQEVKFREAARLRDALTDVKRETSSLTLMESNATWGTQRIIELQQLLQKTEADIAETLEYRQQLVFMHKRQVKNQKTMEMHLKDLEDNVIKSKEELQYLTDLMRELEAAKNKVVVEITNKQIEYERKTHDREKQLINRSQEADNAIRMEKWRNDRGRLKREAEAEARGDLTKEEEEKLLKELAARQEVARVFKVEVDAHNEKLASLENVFQRIRQVTGVATLDDMVEKFLGQENTKVTLEDERLRTDKALNTLNEEKASLMNELNLTKAQGIGSMDLTKEAQEEMENQIYKAKHSGTVSKAAHDRLDSLMLALQQGAVGLHEKMSQYSYLLESNDIKDLHNHKTGHETVDLLNMCQVQLIKLIEATSVSNDKGYDAEGEDVNASREDLGTANSIFASKITAGNVRVKSRMDLLFDESVVDESEVVEELEPTNDEEYVQLVDRRTIKRDSKKVMEQERKKADATKKAETAEAADGGDKGRGGRHSPVHRKKAQEQMMLRLLSANAKSPPPNEEENKAFVTQMPVLL